MEFLAIIEILCKECLLSLYLKGSVCSNQTSFYQGFVSQASYSAVSVQNVEVKNHFVFLK